MRGMGVPKGKQARKSEFQKTQGTGTNLGANGPSSEVRVSRKGWETSLRQKWGKKEGFSPIKGGTTPSSRKGLQTRKQKPYKERTMCKGARGKGKD